VLNFAQGAMVYFAALSVVGVMEKGAPLWLAILASFVLMILLGLATEKFVLRKMVNQPPIALFMATIGLSYFIEGLGPLLWGNEVRALEIGLVDEPIPYFLDTFNIVISRFDLVASGLAFSLVALLALFFQYTRIGRALRAVADDHQAALSIGIPLKHIWALVWAVAGFVALVAGLLWGARNGAQFALTFTALKALPVLILGGFTSVPGAIVGGLIIGASEKLAEIYIPPVMVSLFGGNFGGIEGWFPYVLALLFLLVRPEGLFGERHIDRV
ncbi:MAG: branched-chain amino acid ABC transporter permease, partial [Rhodocyclaceae bacterium]